MKQIAAWRIYVQGIWKEKDIELDNGFQTGFNVDLIQDIDKKLIKNVFIAYPPDDSLVAIYIGLKSSASVQYQEDAESLTVLVSEMV